MLLVPALPPGCGACLLCPLGWITRASHVSFMSVMVPGPRCFQRGLSGSAASSPMPPGRSHQLLPLSVGDKQTPSKHGASRRSSLLCRWALPPPSQSWKPQGSVKHASSPGPSVLAPQCAGATSPGRSPEQGWGLLTSTRVFPVRALLQGHALGV